MHHLTIGNFLTIGVGLVLIIGSFGGMRMLRTRLLASSTAAQWRRLAVQLLLAGLRYSGLLMVLTLHGAEVLPTTLLFAAGVLVLLALVAGVYRELKPIDAEFNLAWQQAHLRAGRSLRIPGDTAGSGLVLQRFRLQWLTERQLGVSAATFVAEHWAQIEDQL